MQIFSKPQPPRDTPWSALGMDWLKFRRLAGGLVHSTYRDGEDPNREWGRHLVRRAAEFVKKHS